MPVIELAKLRLQHNQQHISQTLRGKLSKAKTAMEESSGYTFNYYRSVEELKLIFIVGAWPSVKFHLHKFIPVAANRELLELLKDEIVVEWMFHIQGTSGRIPPPVEIEVVFINSKYIGTSKEECLDEVTASNQHDFRTYTEPGKFIVGGWKVEDDQELAPAINQRGVFVLLMGKEKGTQQAELPQEHKSKMQSGTHNHDGFEIYPVKLLDVDNGT